MTITRESSSIIDFAAAMRDKDKTSNLPPLPFAEMVPNPPPREWFLHERILANVVALFSGDGAAGKSFLLLQLFVAAIIGRDWLGLLPKQGPVIYFCEAMTRLFAADKIKIVTEGPPSHRRSRLVEV
jgi:hypothetical protein